MARSRDDERRLLSAEEFTLVDKTRHPGLGLLPDHDLHELLKHVREKRDRARDIAARQRREMRGKSAPRGLTAASDNTGTRAKRDHLAQAVQRLNKEATRREAKAARDALVDSAKRALELRKARTEKAARVSASRSSNEGMRSKGAPKKSFQRNRAKLGEVSQHNKNVQAKHDSR